MICLLRLIVNRTILEASIVGKTFLLHMGVVGKINACGYTAESSGYRYALLRQVDVELCSTSYGRERRCVWPLVGCYRVNLKHQERRSLSHCFTQLLQLTWDSGYPLRRVAVVVSIPVQIGKASLDYVRWVAAQLLSHIDPPLVQVSVSNSVESPSCLVEALGQWLYLWKAQLSKL